jgi:uncharacterized protein (TIGR03435 family)
LKDPPDDELPPVAKEDGCAALYGLLKEKDGFLRFPSIFPMPAVGSTRSVSWATPPINHVVGGGQPITGLVDFLSRQSGRLVVDKTGLTGNWDYNLEFALGAGAANSPNNPSDPAPDLIAAVRDQPILCSLRDNLEFESHQVLTAPDGTARCANIRPSS